MSPFVTTVALLFAAEPPKTVEIIATDADTGKPVSGAVIRLFNGPRPTPYAFTDAAGKAIASLPDEGKMTIDIHTPSHIQQRVELSTKNPKVEIKLRKGERTVGGVVVDEAGKPIAGATIRFSAYLGKPKRPAPGMLELVCDIDAVTDAEGRWRLQVVDQNPNNLHFDVKHPEFVYQWSHKPTAQNILSGTEKIVMKRGVEIRGKVVDEKGQPVEGASIVAVSGYNPAIDFTSSVRTRADGTFRFGSLEHGRNTLTVQASGRSPTVRVFERLEKPTEATITMPPGRKLTGRVTDSKGNAVPGATVYASLRGRESALRLWTTCKSDGAYELLDAPDEDFQLRASKTGYLFDQGSTIPSGKTTASFVLKSGPKLRGNVVDAATGKPISNFTVGFNFCGMDPSTGKTMPAPFGTNKHFEETKGKDGRFELTHSQTLDRSAQVAAWAPGYKLTRSEPFPNDGKDHDFQLKLEKDTRTNLTGVVKLPDGKPAAGAPLSGRRKPMAFLDSPMAPSSTNLELGVGNDAMIRDVFPFPPIDEPFVLGASHDGGWAKWEPKQGAKAGDQIDIPLIAWATIKGKLILEGKPKAGAAIRYYADRSMFLDEQRLTVEFDARTTTKTNGEFTLDRVPTISGKIFRFVDFGRGGGPNLIIASVNPKPGETLEFPVAHQQGRTVVGRLKLPPSLKGGVADPNSPSYVCTGTECQATSDRPWTPFPPEIKQQSRQAQSEWLMKWIKSPEGKAYHQNYQRLMVWLEPDGRFRIDGAKADSLMLKMPLRAPGASENEQGDLLATVSKRFVVPPMPSGFDDSPLDIGEIDVVESKVVRLGQKMPEIAAANLDGAGEWKLSSDSGKVRLIDFWATWCGPCVKAFPTLAALHQELGGKGLAIVSLSTDEDAKTASAFVKKEKCAWRQTHIGSNSPIMQSLAIDAIPTFFVVGKDDTVLYRGHSPEAAASAVRTALAK